MPNLITLAVSLLPLALLAVVVIFALRLDKRFIAGTTHPERWSRVLLWINGIALLAAVGGAVLSDQARGLFIVANLVLAVAWVGAFRLYRSKQYREAFWVSLVAWFFCVALVTPHWAR